MTKIEKQARKVGRYEIFEEIGRGGMATVYRARDTSLGREVALKLLHPHLGDHKEARDRFRREAQAVASLQHDNIVEVYDYSGDDEDDVFLVMELIKGVTLREFLCKFDGRPIIAEAAALIGRQIFLALHAAHEQGIVHRDVKPENILIGNDGQVKLSDFGIAHLVGLTQMTVTGQILGSPAFMSPEHIEQAELDARADIFSAGTMLYEIAVGSLPFNGNNPHQIIKRIVEGYYDQPLVVNPAVGHDVSVAIVRCLQQNPDRRYQTAQEAADDLAVAVELMGIDASASELARFFGDPEGWESSFRSGIIDRTLALGKTARKSRRLPEAMDHFNRVLAMEPGNDRALDAVSGLSRRRRWRRLVERVTAGMVFVLVLAAIVWGIVMVTEGVDPNSVDGPDVEDGKDTAEVASSEPPEVVKPKEDVTDTETPEVSVTEKPVAEHVVAKRFIPRIKARRTVLFKPIPGRVEIVIDGAESFVYKTFDRTRDLTHGRHSVQFIPVDERLQTATVSFEVKLGEGPQTVAARLKWKPATLHVACNVRADVSVEGITTGKTNKGFTVPLRGEAQSRVKILISAKGYRPVTRQVTITAGKTANEIVNLEEEAAPSEG